MCSHLKWVLNVKPEDLHDFEAMFRKEYSSTSSTPAPVAVPVARQPAEPRKQAAADFNANPYPAPVSTPPSPLHSTRRHLHPHYAKHCCPLTQSRS
jgi:hypothetical protein